MTPWMVLWAGFSLGLLTSVSPCPLATNIAAISFVGRSVGSARGVLLSGLLYALGRTLVYVALGAGVLLGMQAASTAATARFLQKYIGMALGPMLILVGMVLLEMLGSSISLRFGGRRLQDRLAKTGAFWALPLGMLFALSFCPISAGLFFGGLMALSLQHSSPLLLPTLFGIGTAVPVVAFAFVIAFAARSVGRAFNFVGWLEWRVRWLAGVIFVMAGVYYCLINIYGVSLGPW